MLLNNKAHREERKYTNQLNLSHCGISNPHNIVQFYVFSPCSHFPSQNIFSSTPNKLLISVKGKKKIFLFLCLCPNCSLCALTANPPTYHIPIHQRMISDTSSSTKLENSHSSNSFAVYAFIYIHMCIYTCNIIFIYQLY